MWKRASEFLVDNLHTTSIDVRMIVDRFIARRSIQCKVTAAFFVSQFSSCDWFAFALTSETARQKNRIDFAAPVQVQSKPITIGVEQFAYHIFIATYVILCYSTIAIRNSQCDSFSSLPPPTISIESRTSFWLCPPDTQRQLSSRYLCVVKSISYRLRSLASAQMEFASRAFHSNICSDLTSHFV